MDIPTTKVFADLCEAWEKYRCLVLSGGSRSSKTTSILQKIIQEILNSPRPLIVFIIRGKRSWFDTSSLKDFKEIMQDHFKMWDDNNWNISKYVYNLNGSDIHFIGLDNEDGRKKAHGGKSDIAYFNEAIELNFDSVKQVMIRNKGKLIFDFNPNCPADHWVFASISTREDCAIMHSTFKDNIFVMFDDKGELRPEIKELLLLEPTPENIKRGTANAEEWSIYGQGIRAMLKGLIFPIHYDVPEIPAKARNGCFGLDFGFIAPASLVFKAEWNGELYLDEWFYMAGCTTLIPKDTTKQPSLQGEFERLEVPKNVRIWADPENAQGIADLKSVGYDIVSAKKPSGSIVDGIKVMKRYSRINITSRSANLRKEMNRYKWKTNKNGDVLEEVHKVFDHAIDASRYATWMSEPNSGFNSGVNALEPIEMPNGANRYDIWSAGRLEDEADERYQYFQSVRYK